MNASVNCQQPELVEEQVWSWTIYGQLTEDELAAHHALHNRLTG